MHRRLLNQKIIKTECALAAGFVRRPALFLYNIMQAISVRACMNVGFNYFINSASFSFIVFFPFLEMDYLVFSS